MKQHIKHITCCIFLSIVFLQKGFTQDIHFSQFFEQPLLRNPALAGLFTGDVRFTGSFRNQWQSVTDPYRTYSCTGEIKFPAPVFTDDNMTFGFQLANDEAGTSKMSNTQFLPTLNFHKSLNENNANLSAAIMLGFIQHKFDPTKLVFNDQFLAQSNGSFTISPSSNQTFTKTNITYHDISAGITYSNVLKDETDYYIGLGLFHITQPNVAFFEGNTVKRNLKWAINVGFATPTSEENEFDFYADYFKQGGHHSFQGGIMYSHNFSQIDDSYKTIKGGILYRWNDAIIPVIQLVLGNFNISTSYDINVSQLVKASQYRGGIEVTLSFKNFLNFRNSETRAMRCPRFGGSGMPEGKFLGY